MSEQEIKAKWFEVRPERKQIGEHFIALTIEELFRLKIHGLVPLVDLAKDKGSDPFNSTIFPFQPGSLRRSIQDILRNDPSLEQSINATFYYSVHVSTAAWHLVLAKINNGSATTETNANYNRLLQITEGTHLDPNTYVSDEVEGYIRRAFGTASKSYASIVTLTSAFAKPLGKTEQEIIAEANNYPLAMKLAKNGPNALGVIHSIADNYQKFIDAGVFYYKELNNGKSRVMIDEQKWSEYVREANPIDQFRPDGICPAAQVMQTQKNGYVEEEFPTPVTAIKAHQEFFIENLAGLRAGIDWQNGRNEIPAPRNLNLWDKLKIAWNAR